MFPLLSVTKIFNLKKNILFKKKDILFKNSKKKK